MGPLGGWLGGFTGEERVESVCGNCKRNSSRRHFRRVFIWICGTLSVRDFG